MNFLLNTIMFFVTPIVMLIAFVLHITKVLIKQIRELSTMDEKNREVSVESNILSWHGENINLDDMGVILYGITSKDKYLFWYILKNENMYYQSSSTSVELYDQRKHKLNKKDSIFFKKMLERESLKVIPSMWLKAPIGLMGCSITGGFRKNDFITLAGDNKKICISQGLDANPSNMSIEVFETEFFIFEDNIFLKKMNYKQSNRYESEYQAYILNHTVTLDEGYIFIPWKDKKIELNHILYFDDVKELNEKIINYFALNDNLIKSNKNCRLRNNP